METKIIIYILFGLTILLSLMYIWISQLKAREKNITNILNNPIDKPINTYNGLVLFDIDGTLTTRSASENEKLVDTCIERGWAVGICTAGPVYYPDNIMSYPWMPRNLYIFMKNHDFSTFNNVYNEILLGKLNKNAYRSIQPPLGTELYGYRKGFALTYNGKSMNITNPSCLILCDDMTVFLKGAKTYNPGLNLVCAGSNCGGELTSERLIEAMNKCSTKM